MATEAGRQYKEGEEDAKDQETTQDAKSKEEEDGGVDAERMTALIKQDPTPLASRFLPGQGHHRPVGKNASRTHAWLQTIIAQTGSRFWFFNHPTCAQQYCDECIPIHAGGRGEVRVACACLDWGSVGTYRALSIR